MTSPSAMSLSPRKNPSRCPAMPTLPRSPGRVVSSMWPTARLSVQSSGLRGREPPDGGGESEAARAAGAYFSDSSKPDPGGRPQGRVGARGLAAAFRAAVETGRCRGGRLDPMGRVPPRTQAGPRSTPGVRSIAPRTSTSPAASRLITTGCRSSTNPPTSVAGREVDCQRKGPAGCTHRAVRHQKSSDRS